MCSPAHYTGGRIPENVGVSLNRRLKLSCAESKQIGGDGRRVRVSEIMAEGKYVPLTTGNICNELDGVNSMRLGNWLNVSTHQHDRQHSTQANQTRAIIDYWLSVDPTPSWRRVMWALECSEEHKAAERVKPYVELLTDPSLTAENVSSVLETLSDWERMSLYLGVPSSRRGIIKRECLTESLRRQAAVDWWLRYSPAASWTWLAGRLYRCEERTALEAVSQYIHKETADPTLTRTNLWSVLGGVTDWWINDGPGFGLCILLEVPGSVANEIKQQTSDATQQKKTLLERWLRDHPAPSWAVVAEALYKVPEEHGVLEQVKKMYITGSQQLFQNAMQHGHVNSSITTVLVTGTAGSGKTCSKHVIIGEPPPRVRKSTPCAEHPIRVASVGVRDDKWGRIGPKRLMNYLAAAIKLDNARTARKARKSRVTHEDTESSSKGLQSQPLSSSKPDIEARSTNETVASSTQESSLESGASYIGEEDSSTSDKASLKSLLEAAVTEEELVRLIEQTTSSDMLHEIAWVQFVDSGGQPQFLEVLPIFLRRTSVWVYVLKLSERLDEYPTIEFYDVNGSRIGKPYAAAYTNMQIFQQFIQTIRSHKAAGHKSPKILVIGTHRDKQSECTESLEEKNKILSKLLKPLADDVIYSNLAQGDLIFPLNAQSPDKFDHKIAEEIRALIMRQCSPKPDEIPLGWYALQLKLREIAEALGREVISREECLAVARKLHMDEKSLDAALEFLDNLSAIYYFKDILPKAIFCDTQVLLDKATELVEFSYKLRDSSKCEFVARAGEWKKFSEYGLVNSSFLDTFEKHYVPGVFTSQELIKLFRALLILADFPKPGYHFMPCLLQRISQTEVAKHRTPHTCFITHFPHGGRLGMFCTLIAYLLSPENRFPCAWNVIVSEATNAPLCLYRNCIKFALPHFPGKVTLIDSVDFFEIHVDAPPKAVAGLRQYVRSAVLVGLGKAADTLHYTNSKPEIAFPCPCDQGDFHVAAVNLKQSWWLCSTNQRMFGDLEEKHTVWLPVKIPFTSAEATSVEEAISELPTASKKRKLDEKVADPWPLSIRPPTLKELLSIKTTEWFRLGLELGLEEYDLEIIEKDRRLDASGALRDVLRKWQRQCEDPTWGAVVRALREIGEGREAKRLEDKFCKL